MYAYNGWQFLVSNIAAWRAHIAAAHHLIRLRGGLDALGVGGYLKKFVLGYEALARAELKKKGGC